MHQPKASGSGYVLLQQHALKTLIHWLRPTSLLRVPPLAKFQSLAQARVETLSQLCVPVWGVKSGSRFLLYVTRYKSAADGLKKNQLKEP